MLYNKPLFSERHLDLLRDLHKAVRDFCGMVAAVGCSSFALPALLPTVSGKAAGIGEIRPAGHTLVHNLVDLADFPLLRLVKSMVQRLDRKSVV